MATIRSIDFSLTADTKRLQRDLKRSRFLWRNYSRDVTQSLRSIGKTVAASLTVATVALTAAARQSLNVADQIAKSARNAGLSAEGYQRLAEAFRLGGAEEEVLTQTTNRLSQALYELSLESETYKRAFDELNLSLSDFTNLSLEESFLKVREALSLVDDDARRLALGNVLLGGATEKLGSILNQTTAEFVRQGTRLQALGGVIREELLTDTEALNDAVSTAGTVIRAQFTNALLEALQVGQNLEGIDSRIARIGQVTHEASVFIFDSIQRLVNFFSTFRRELVLAVEAYLVFRVAVFGQAALTAIYGFGRAMLTAAGALRSFGLVAATATAVSAAIPTAIGAALVAAATVLYQFRDAVFDLVRNIGLGLAQIATGVSRVILGWIDTLLEQIQIGLDGIFALINRGLAAIGRDPIEIQFQIGDTLDTALRALDNKVSQLEIRADSAGVDLQGSIAEGVNNIRNLMSQIRETFGKLTGGVETINSMILGTATTLQEINTDIIGLRRRNPGVGIPGSIDPDGDEETLGDRISQGIEQSLQQGLRNLSFKDFAVGVLESLQSSLADTVGKNLFDFLKGLFSNIFSSLGGAGGGGGLLGSLGGLGGLFGGLFHRGGIVPGSPGQDVFIAARAGERVLTERQNAAVENALGMPMGLTVNQYLTGNVDDATRRAMHNQANDLADTVFANLRERRLLGALT